MLLAYAKLVARRRSARQPTCRTIPISAASSSAISRTQMRERFPDAHRRASAAARDHRDPARERDDQPRRPDRSHAPRRPDRRRRADDRARPSRRCATLRPTELNTAIDALDGTVPGALQLELYAAAAGSAARAASSGSSATSTSSAALEAVVGTYRTGIAEVGRASPRRSRRAPSRPGGARRGACSAGRAARSLPAVSRRCPTSSPRPTSSSSPRRPGGRSPRSRRPISPSRRCSGSAASSAPARGDREGLLRPPGARPRHRRIAAAHRRLTAEAVAQGGAGPAGVEAWSAARGAEAERIRTAVETIAASGLTLSKLTVAASLLGDLARA